MAKEEEEVKGRKKKKENLWNFKFLFYIFH